MTKVRKEARVSKKRKLVTHLHQARCGHCGSQDFRVVFKAVAAGELDIESPGDYDAEENEYNYDILKGLFKLREPAIGAIRCLDCKRQIRCPDIRYVITQAVLRAAKRDDISVRGS